MATRLWGGEALNRTKGSTNAQNPPNISFREGIDNYPSIHDINYNLGDEIIHSYTDTDGRHYDVYKLVSLEGDGTTLGCKANWGLVSSGTGALDSLRGSDGQIVNGNGGTLDLVGDNINIKTRKLSPTSMQIYYEGQPGELFYCNDGNYATPDSVTGRLNLYGGSNLATAKTGDNQVTFNLNNDVDISGYFKCGDYLHAVGVITADTGIVVVADGIDSTGTTILRDLATVSTTGLVFADHLGRLSAVTSTADGAIPICDATGLISFGQIQADPMGSVTVVNSGGVITVGGGGGFPVGATDGQILIGSTGNPPVLNTLTAGAGITIGNAAGAITISAAGGAGGGVTTAHTDLGVDANVSLTGEMSFFGSGSIETTGSNPPLCGLVSISLKDDVNIVSSLNLDWCNHIGVLQVDATGHVYNNYGVNGSLLISGGTGPVWNQLTAGAGITIDYPSDNQIRITNTGGAGSGLSFLTNSGTATPALNEIKIYGGTNITTSGASDTVTVSISGPITVANGGTGVASFSTAYAPVYVGAAKTTLVGMSSAGTSGQILQSKGAASAPAYTTATYPSTVTQGSILYGSASNTVDDLAKSTTATRYIANTGTSNNPKWDQVNLANGVTGTLPAGNGGTGNTTYTTDGIIYYDGSKMASTSAGTAGQVLTSNGPGVAPTYQTGGGGGSGYAFRAVQEVNASGLDMAGYYLGRNARLTTVSGVGGYDSGSSWYPGDGAGTACRFTIPTAGIWYFNANAQITTEAPRKTLGTPLIIQIEVYNSTDDFLYYLASDSRYSYLDAASPYTPQAIGEGKLEVGDYLLFFIRGFSASGTTYTLKGWGGPRTLTIQTSVCGRFIRTI